MPTGKSKAVYLHPTVHMHIGNLNRGHTVTGNFEH